jgi:hypothetical protein
MGEHILVLVDKNQELKEVSLIFFITKSSLGEDKESSGLFNDE